MFKLFDAVYTGDYALASLIASVIIVIVLAVEGPGLSHQPGKEEQAPCILNLTASEQELRRQKRRGAATCPSALAQGELLCILGSSGCGKTTTLNMIGGFLAPDSGQHPAWTEQDITAIPPERRPVTTVFQSYGLFPHMTVLENVTYGLKFQRLYRRSEAREKGMSVPGAGGPCRPRRVRISTRSAAASSSGWPWPGP